MACSERKQSEAFPELRNTCLNHGCLVMTFLTLLWWLFLPSVDHLNGWPACIYRGHFERDVLCKHCWVSIVSSTVWSSRDTKVIVIDVFIKKKKLFTPLKGWAFCCQRVCLYHWHLFSRRKIIPFVGHLLKCHVFHIH